MRRGALVLALALGACAPPPVRREPLPDPEWLGRRPARAARAPSGAPADVARPTVDEPALETGWKPLRTSLRNGVAVAVVERPDLPMVAISIRVLPSSEEPLMLRQAFAARMIHREEAQWSRGYLDRIGAHGTTRYDEGTIAVTVQVLSPFFERIVEHLAHSLATSEYGDDDVQVVRDIATASWSPWRTVRAEVSALTFPGRAYGESIDTSLRKGAAVDAKALRAFHVRNVVASRVVVSVVGAVRADAARSVLERTVGALKNGPAFTPSAVPAPRGAETVVLDRPGAGEALVGASLRLPAPAAPDYDAARVCVAAWSDRLWDTLRLRRGAAYTPVGTLMWTPEAAAVVGMATVAHEDVVAALDAMMSEAAPAADLARERREELWRTVAYRPSSAADAATELSRRLALGMPLVDAQAPSSEAVARVAATLGSAPVSSVVLGDARALKAALTARGRPFSVRPAP